MNASRTGLAAAFAAGLALAPVLPAQEDMIAKRDDKLASDFLKNGDWTTDYDRARELAKESGKPIFGYFTRSYAY